VGGFLGLPSVFYHTHWLKNFLAPVFAPSATEAAEAGHSMELILMGVAVTLALVAIGWAYNRFIAKKTLPAEEGKLTGFANLVYKKYLIDELYDTIVTRPLLFISEWGYDVVDRIMVDGIVVGTGRFSLMTGKQLRQLQSGNIGFYLLMMVVGIIGVLLYLLKAL